ncbi:hypothetical protein F8G81_05460 [Arthrobacter sp. CDRTa11]|uniref:beta strand repeat-containing protein n=1 Tax=Arthrobacter sp. CDRTa11 TaxID=2651199 RepID=UPI002265D53A|nr:hypothetical protein [Arthrobacter sp. CDRTa11]UZX02127.1 hypothetical protein F8G81_05460 [Arthrobacter sp. CDRTa11]
MGGLLRAQHAVVVFVLAVATLLAPGIEPALAYSTGPVSGTSSATLGSLQPPTNVSVPSSSTGTVRVSWTAAVGTPTPSGYFVTRTKTSDGSTTAACGTSASATITGSACDDFTVPVGDYRYTVTSVYRTWTASSASSGSVGVTPPGSAAKLLFLTQPANSSSGVALPTQPVVVVTDVNGSIVITQAPTLVSITASGGLLTGCLPATTVNGTATFSGCTVTGPGTYTLTAASFPLTSAVSTAFTVAGTAAKLGFTTSPSGATGGAVFAAQPAVSVQDSSSRTVTTSTAPITLSLSSSPAGATLSCDSNPKSAAAGAASFSGCRIDKAGTYTLTASGAGFTTVSASFTVTIGAATRLAFTTQPSGSTGSVSFGTQPAVSIQDDGGNTVPTSAATVDLTLTGTTGATLNCTATQVAAAAGVATFSGCSINRAGTYTLTATSAGLIFTLSDTVAIAAGAPAKLGFTVQPSQATAGSAFASQPAVALQDAGGNTAGGTAAITLSITGAPGETILSCAANTVTTTAGLASFSGCSINKAGTYTLTATGAGFTATSVNFTVAVGTPTKLGFTTNPANSTGGVPFPAQPVVAIQDAGGNTMTGSTAAVTLTITTPTGATLACAANPVAAVSGVSAFVGCSINRPGTYTLTATSGSLTAAVSTSITVTTGPAAKLAFITSPSTSPVNTIFATQPSVAVQDAGGNAITGSTAPVTLKISSPSGGASLTCTSNPKNAVSGVATFAGCRISKTGTRTLTATSGTLTAGTSASFNITGGTATKLSVTTSPGGSTGGVAFPTQPVVTILDADGNPTASTAAVTLSITTPGGSVLACTSNPKTAVSGVAAFTGCSINKPGTYTLTATSGTLTAAVSSSFTVTTGPAAKLGFSGSPSNSVYNAVFATQPAVAVQDAGGNTVTGSAASVTLSITTPAGAVLACTQNPVNAVSGLAAFAGCSIDKAGTYTLTAASGGLTPATSATFTIAGGNPTKLAFTTNPANSTGGIAFPTQPAVSIQDDAGNTTTSTASVTLNITTPGGAVLACTSNPKAATAGVAAFTGCAMNKAGTYTLTATSGSLTTAVSSSFTISVGPATHLVFTTQPAGASVNTAFTTQPVVTVQDAGGNTVTGSTAAVTLAITEKQGNPTLTCTANPQNAVAGLSTFSGCRISRTGTRTLTATSTGLTAAVSDPFMVQ